jgi:hypothetical protein
MTTMNGSGEVHPVRRKSPALAAVLSILPGLGQIYIGFYRRGFLQILVTAGTISLLNSGRLHHAEPLFALFLSFFWFFAVIDAVRMAQLYNDAMSGLNDEEMRKSLAAAGDRGSIGGGILLFGAGLLALLHNLFDLPLEWLADWWPLVPVIFGGYLLYRGIRDRRKRAL